MEAAPVQAKDPARLGAPIGNQDHLGEGRHGKDRDRHEGGPDLQEEGHDRPDVKLLQKELGHPEAGTIQAENHQ